MRAVEESNGVGESDPSAGGNEFTTGAVSISAIFKVQVRAENVAAEDSFGRDCRPNHYGAEREHLISRDVLAMTQALEDSTDIQLLEYSK